MSTRREIMDALRDAWRSARGGIYQVRRGPVEWASFNFEAFPYAVALLVEDGPLDLPPRFFGQSEGLREVTVAVQVVQRTPNDPTQEFDDGIQERFLEDIAVTIADLFKRTSTQGGPLIGAVSKDSTIADAFDASVGIQGVVAAITLRYTEVST